MVIRYILSTVVHLSAISQPGSYLAIVRVPFIVIWLAVVDMVTMIYLDIFSCQVISSTFGYEFTTDQWAINDHDKSCDRWRNYCEPRLKYCTNIIIIILFQNITSTVFKIFQTVPQRSMTIKYYNTKILNIQYDNY